MIKIEAVIFDWGDTLMRDFPHYEGPMLEWPEIEVLPGVAPTLKELKPDFTLAVASSARSSNGEMLRRALQRGQIAHYFNFFLTGQELKSQKPHLDFFRNICRKVGYPPGQCLMVGDNLEKDIIPARRLGMKAAWLTAEKEPQGDYWKISRIQEVLELIKGRAV